MQSFHHVLAQLQEEKTVGKDEDQIDMSEGGKGVAERRESNTNEQGVTANGAMWDGDE